MTDPHDPLDVALRDALQAEACGVEAGPDLLARIHAAGAPRRDRRRPLVLVAAAVVAVVAGVGALAASRGEDDAQRVRVTDGSSTATTGCVEEADGALVCGTSGPRPDTVVLLREDGWIVTMDLRTGVQQELITRGDPSGADAGEGGPTFIDRVELSPDSAWIYFSVCCEPAVGTTHRIPSTGGEAELVAYGWEPKVSPDGRFVAVKSDDGFIWIYPSEPPADGSPNQAVATFDDAGSPRDLAWSPDGERLAYVDGGDNGLGTARVLRWDGASLTPDRQTRPVPDVAWVDWTKDGALAPVGGTELANDRAYGSDRSHQWIVMVEDGGRVTYRAGDGSTPRPLADAPAANDADW